MREQTCDDGNGLSGDGCSSTCQYAASATPYDCDVLGHPCQQRCGWVGETALMAGYILPQATTCANITYYDYASYSAEGARFAFIIPAAGSAIAKLWIRHS